jgi:hypothetical protein
MILNLRGYFVKLKLSFTGGEDRLGKIKEGYEDDFIFAPTFAMKYFTMARAISPKKRKLINKILLISSVVFILT